MSATVVPFPPRGARIAAQRDITPALSIVTLDDGTDAVVIRDEDMPGPAVESLSAAELEALARAALAAAARKRTGEASG